MKTKMGTELLLKILELYRVINDDSIENHLKEEIYKETVKYIIETRDDFGYITKQDLKNIVDLAKSDNQLMNMVITYFNTHDTRL